MKSTPTPAKVASPQAAGTAASVPTPAGLPPEPMTASPGAVPLPPAPTSSGEKSGDKERDRKKKKARDTALAIRNLHWPKVQPSQLWLLDGKRGGFAQVPRTLSLITNVIRAAVKIKTGKSSAAGNTYMVLWLHIYGEGLAKIESEREAAFEAGYGGERSTSTFHAHMNVLKDLGFIDFGEGSLGKMQWVLMLNPYIVLKTLHDGGLVEKKYYAALLERLSAIGSSDELKGDDHASA